MSGGQVSLRWGALVAGIAIILVGRVSLGAQAPTAAAQPAPSAVRVIKGEIRDLDADTRQLRIVEPSGSEKALVYEKVTRFLAGNARVPVSLAMQGMTATVSYREETGPGVGPGRGLRPLIYTATEVRFEASAAEVLSKAEPAERFIATVAGTVTNTKSGLTWQARDDGNLRTWKEASAYCATLTLGGFKDWRLPGLDEHSDAVVVELARPKRNPKDVADWYWTSDPTMAVPFDYPVSHVALSAAFDLKETARLYARCVRGTAKK